MKVDPKYNIGLNKVTLNFSNVEFEKEFRQDYFEKSVLVLRISVFTTILLYAAFGLLDWLTTPQYLNEFLTIRLIMVIPILIVFIGISFLKNFRKYWHLLSSFVLVVAGSGIIYMLHRNPENMYYYGGLFLIFMGGYFFLRLRFFTAFLTGLILVVIYNLAYFIIPLHSASSGTNVITANAFFIASNIICMIGLYSIERLRRIDFYLQKLLADKQIEIENNNVKLEVTVKERTHDLILAKNKAEESERLKSAFLANMSHEIRTPMNGILGFSDLLKNPKLSGEEQQYFISIIEKSGARMLRTVNDIVEISKIEAGELDIILSVINIKDEIVALYDFFQPEAEQKGLCLELELDVKSEVENISTDKSKFSSIVTNLIKNAIKYTDTGYVKIECKINNGFFNCFVEDSGIGVPKDRVDAIFNRFEQADITDKNAKQGSGLGLAIAKSYVEMLGGNIWVESKCNLADYSDNIGSVFGFSLPLLSENPTLISVEKQKEVWQPDANIKYTILIVDDDVNSTHFLSILLSEFANKILIASDGDRAVELVELEPEIDFVLMDVKMPRMNGYEATKKIKKINPGLPVIITTAYAYPRDKERAEKSGCDAFLTKPIEKQKLLKLLGIIRKA